MAQNLRAMFLLQSIIKMLSTNKISTLHTIEINDSKLDINWSSTYEAFDEFATENVKANFEAP